MSIVASQDFDLGRLGVITLRYNGAWTDDVYFDATGGVGVPNAEWGEEVKAVVEPVGNGARGSELARELLDFCRDRLARFKCPQSIDIVDKLPRSDNGKLYKRRLREQYRRGVDA